MNAWAPHLDEHWFAVALATGIRRKPVRVMLLDRPIVLARMDRQKIVAFEDRCPHRQAPLSKGRLVGGTLQCPYHGWRFNERGELRELPGAPPGACLPGIRARTIAAIEHDGLIWVRRGGQGRDDIPARVRALASRDRKFLWQTTWHANIVDALENVLDPLHTHFVHAGLVRKPDARREVRVNLRTEEDGFVVDYAGQAAQSGLLYRLFESPRESERAYFSAPGTAQLEYRYRNGSRACISMHFSPEAADRTRLIATLHLEGRRVPAWIIKALVWPFIRRVAQQDRRILALQAENTRMFPDRKDAITDFDIVRKGLAATWGHSPPRCATSFTDCDTSLWL